MCFRNFIQLWKVPRICSIGYARAAMQMRRLAKWICALNIWMQRRKIATWVKNSINQFPPPCLIAFIHYSQSSSQSLHYSRERGTAYICNNKLIAILADINHPKNAEICSSTRRTTAFYVSATMHLEWLLSEDMGITNLGMKNRSDSQNSSSWSSTTEASAISTATTPPKKNSCEKINENLLILLFLAGAVLVFSNGFDKI